MGIFQDLTSPVLLHSTTSQSQKSILNSCCFSYKTETYVMLVHSTSQSETSTLKENILTLTVLYFCNKVASSKTQSDLKLKS